MKVSSVLWSRKNAKGQYPIKIRISQTIRGKTSTKYITTPFSTSKTHWRKNRVKPTRTDYLDINDQLDKVELKAKVFISENPSCSVTQLINHLSQVENSQPQSTTLKDYANTIINEFTNARTKKSRITTLNSIDDFHPNIPLMEIDWDYLKRLEAYLRSKGNSNTTIKGKMKVLGTWLNRAKGAKLIPATPMDEYKKPSDSTKPKTTLTLDQIKKMYEAALYGNEHIARDIFLFMFFAEGCRITDALLMKKSCIKGDTLTYFPNKTIKNNKIKRIYISDPMRKIIDRQTGHKRIFPLCPEDITPENNYKKIDSCISIVNNNLKKICNKLDLPRVSAHCARHTFSMLSIENGASLTDVMKSLGHSSASTTDAYLKSLQRGNNKEFLSKMFSSL